MRWHYQLLEADQRARRVRQERLLLLVAVLCVVLLAVLPTVP